MTVDRWVGAAGDDVERYFVDNDCVEVVCRNHYASEKLWSTRDRIAPLRAEIYTHGTLYATDRVSKYWSNTFYSVAAIMAGNLFLQVADTNWQASQTQFALEMINNAGGTVLVYSQDSDRDYPIQAIKPYVSEKRLNKPIDELLRDGGQPLGMWDEAIANPRRAAIETAIHTQQRYSYTRKYFDWAEWEFVEIVIPTETSAVVIVEDVHRWQADRDMWGAIESAIAQRA